ncbi:MAG: ATP-grasp domain-containing protein [Ktedonobacterales bacterium]
MNTPDTQPKRLLLLLSPNTYRAAAFLDAAARLGVEVVRCIDVPAGLDEWWDVPLAVDFTDVEAATARIVAACRAQPVDAVLAVDDSATILATRAAQELGLPHNPLEAAEAARDKGTMRTLFARYGVPSTAFQRFALASDPHEIAASVRYPCVVKPLRLAGSRGVIRADTPVELIAAITRVKRLLLGDGFALEGTDVLVEDFIPGGEVALEGLLTGGALHVLALFDKPDPLDGPFFEETIYVTPSRLDAATQRAIASVAEQAAQAIGLRDGPVHAELRVSAGGPRMLEIAGRSIGGLCSTILEFGAGMCLEELIVRHALGVAIPSFDRSGQAAGVMMIPIPRAGLLKSVAGVGEAQATPHVTGVEISAKLNNPIVPLPEGASYLGFIFARADDPATAEAALRAAHAELRFDIKPALHVL